jgi:hypothetical protein
VRELAGQSAGKDYLAMTLRGTIVSEALVGRGKPGRRANTPICVGKKAIYQGQGLGFGVVFCHDRDIEKRRSVMDILRDLMVQSVPKRRHVESMEEHMPFSRSKHAYPSNCCSFGGVLMYWCNEYVPNMS